MEQYAERYLIEFASIILDYLLLYIGDPTRYRNWLQKHEYIQLIKEVKSEMTSGAIEGWNFILKESDHKQQRLRPDIFLQRVFHCY